ncbi:MAG: hypothetical protein A3F84_18075 [Candidatus Handelsmanbacteria bacterium RIFCSPLOWO2_12_FULL_64_10]|uniref:non-reducing end alpha-L-arabinofuranosidase n=1 Tax=Handelsmanbacteria sp. (strain RIFCSPLOWO2_12_FULL_64_10) TaxID=1817868 RepID=A0A1F6CM06_HANXR|nr:MAG: hypothetical protein A3F84_18075 [Candidatus Handelsmanbacteria bacterium RIFCSPLOWO2_12_FULL_64_10]
MLELVLAGGLITFSPSRDGVTRIEIDCAQRAERPINRLLFGKFTEHLGRNIYNGMWAQILQNASFADWSYFRPLWARAAREGRTSDYPMDRVLAAYERGLACWWLPYGEPGATYLLDWVAPFSGETSQRIVAPPSGAETGVAQVVYLPAHRVSAYTATLHARGQAGALRVSLVKEDAQETLASAIVKGIHEDWASFEAKLTVPEGALRRGERVEFRVGLVGGGRVHLDQVFLFPDDHISGFDPDVVRLLRESSLPLLRYPGGNFASGYHWKDGVGPIRRRPVRLNRAWSMAEPNHVGTDEFMAFCAAVGCEPMICVNAGDGAPQEAAQWVEYCNGGPDTEFGRMRAENGHTEPYGVRYWEIGNELYGAWQIGHCTPEEYAERYEAFRRAMLAADPGLLLIANGQSLAWNGPLVERKGGIVRSLSLHTLTGGGARRQTDAEKVFRALMGYTATYDHLLQALREQAARTIPDPKVAITELQVFTNVPHLPTNATQTESLFLAGILHSALRQGDLVELITHSALVNHGGGLRKERETVYPNPVHWVSHLYGNLPDATLVRTATSGETFDAEVEGLPKVTGAPLLDAVGALSQDGSRLIVLAINRDPSRAVEAVVQVEGFTPAGITEAQTVAGEGYTSRNTYDHPDAVRLERSEVQVEGPAFKVTFPPHSVTALTLKRKRE